MAKRISKCDFYTRMLRPKRAVISPKRVWVGSRHTLDVSVKLRRRRRDSRSCRSNLDSVLERERHAGRPKTWRARLADREGDGCSSPPTSPSRLPTGAKSAQQVVRRISFQLLRTERSVVESSPLRRQLDEVVPPDDGVVRETAYVWSTGV